MRRTRKWLESLLKCKTNIICGKGTIKKNIMVVFNSLLYPCMSFSISKFYYLTVFLYRKASLNILGRQFSSVLLIKPPKTIIHSVKKARTDQIRLMLSNALSNSIVVLLTSTIKYNH